MYKNAPISVLVYDRLRHFKLCIESLLDNPQARHSILYVFSDAPKLGDEEKVSLVRDYARSIRGFREVRLYFRNENNHKENAKNLELLPTREHGRAIILEDDNIVSPTFLEFMNEALEIYCDESKIISISGFSIPVAKSAYTTNESYLSHLFSGWGHAIWWHKPYFSFLSTQRPYEDMMKLGLEERVAKIHPKLSGALKLIDEGRRVAGDQLLSYLMIKYDLYQIKPVHSLVKNTGHDGTGLNCGVSSKFDVDVCQRRLNPKLDKFVYFQELDRLQYKFFHEMR